MKRPSYYGEKRPVEGEIIAVLEAKGSGLKLSQHWSRALKLHEIHEVMLTADEVAPDEDLPRFTAIAFFEVTQGGHTVLGDKAFLGETELGVLAGYELNHMPNHMKMVFTAKREELPEVRLGQRITIR